MADFAKLLEKARKNYSQQQEKFKKAAPTLVDLRHANATEVKRSDPSPNTTGSSVLASSVSAIRSNHLKKVAQSVANAKKAEEDRKIATVMKMAQAAQAAPPPPPPPPKKAPPPGFDFKKLMEVAQRNTQKGGNESASAGLNGSFSAQSRKEVGQMTKQAASQKSLSKPKAVVARSAPNSSKSINPHKRILAKGASLSANRIPKKLEVNAKANIVKTAPSSLKSAVGQVRKPSVSSAATVKVRSNLDKVGGSTAKTTSTAKNAGKPSVSNKTSMGPNKTNMTPKKTNMASASRKTLPVGHSNSQRPPSAKPSGFTAAKETVKKSMSPLQPTSIKKPAPGVQNKSVNRPSFPREKPLLPFLDRVPSKRKQKPIENYDEEEDSDLEGFIVSDSELDGMDDLDLRGSDSKALAMLREITGYDPASYADYDDDDCRNMESTFRDIDREEAISRKLGLKEDLEDMKMEIEMEKRKKMKRLSASKKPKLT